MSISDFPSATPLVIYRYGDYAPFPSLNAITDKFDYVEKVTRYKESYVLNESSYFLNNKYGSLRTNVPSIDFFYH